MNLRRNLLKEISGIYDAEYYLSWDNTTPNFVTRRQLEEVLDEALRDSVAFGIYVATRHGDCGRRHKYDYPMSDPYGLNITYRDERYLWPGEYLFNGNALKTCPCSKNNYPTDHYVIEDVIYDPNHDLTFARTLYPIFSDIRSAIGQAGDKRPRSAIREYLLRAVIRLNDAILPASVDTYISATKGDEPIS